MPIKQATTGHPAWIAPTLLNGWSNYGSGYDVSGFYKDQFNRVWLRGLIANSGTPVSDSVIFIMPTGYNPQYRALNTVTISQGNGRVDVDTSGNVRWLGHVDNVGGSVVGWLSLSGVSFSTKA